jgi:hypothetical protein
MKQGIVIVAKFRVTRFEDGEPCGLFIGWKNSLV